MTGDDLKAWRDAMGLTTQQAAADLLGYKRSYYNEFENGKREIPDHLPLVCAAHWHRLKPWPICRS